MRWALALAFVFTFIAAAISAASTEAAAPDTYTVQDGDTLLAIAAKVGIPSDQQLDWVNSTVSLNTLDDADHLKLGQTLKLPGSSSSATATVSASTSGGSKTASVASTTYTVKDGDTLLGIAAKLGVPADQQPGWVDSVLALNSMASADKLALGQVLNVPGQQSSSSTTSTVSASTASASSTTLTATSASSPTGALNGSATSYGDSFTGKSMGCTGAGPYSPTDTSIVAVGPSMYDQFPCGTPIEVCGPKGCINAIRKDACPGCATYQVDLSRAGLAAVCGPNSCAVRLRRLS